MASNRSAPKPGGGVTATSPTPEVAAEVQRLTTAEKSKQAVELAKEHHKRVNTPETQSLLVEAYLARIEQFQAKGSMEDAQTLINLVNERFPAHRDRLWALKLRSAAAEGRIDELVAPLARPDLSKEQREAIESALRREWADLPALAGAKALPEGHELRTAAAAAWRAFGAVTSGPVTEEQIELPEISRRSPLAGWKLLVRAIAAFYRKEDAACRRAVEGIPADAAVHRLVPALLAMLDRKPVAGGGAGAALATRVTTDDESRLRAALAAIERAVEYASLSTLRRSIRDALAACHNAHPEMLEKLRQHVSVRCAMSDAPVEEVRTVLGVSRKDSYFWKLLARGMEYEGAAPLAAAYWAQFLRHAVAEKRFAENSPEAAVVYLHMADLLTRLPIGALAERRRQMGRHDTLAQMYASQPPEITALKPGKDVEVVGKALDPEWLYRRAAEIDPDAETFRQWWDWATRHRISDRQKEDIAKLWSAKLPADPEPLLLLMVLAESRNALKMALGHLAKAEAINALNPMVRRARLRLTMATAWRHFKDRKAHLVEKDLAELEAMPAMQEGDRPAVLSAMRAAWHALRGDQAAAEAARDEVVQRMGPLAAKYLVDSVGWTAKLGKGARMPEVPPVANPDPHAIADAEARTVRLGEDLEIEVLRPRTWDEPLNRVLREAPNRLPAEQLLAIGRSALGRENMEQAYLASAAGLATAAGPTAARFLLLRAKSMPFWAERRASQCLRAAMDLAQRAHDQDLMNQIAAEIEKQTSTPWGYSRYSHERLGEELVAEVIKAEREASAYPRTAVEAERHVVAIQSRTGGGGLDEEADEDNFGSWAPGDEEEDDWEDEDEDEYDEEDYDEYEDDDEDASPFGTSPFGRFPGKLPPEATEIAEEVIERFGRVPSPSELMNKAPDLMLRLLAAMGGLSLDDQALGGLLDDLASGPPPGGGGGGGGRRGGRGGKRGRRKRRR